MYYVLVCLSVAACVGTVYTNVFKIEPQAKPEKLADQVGCYVPLIKRVLSYNEKFYSKDEDACTLYVCHESNITTVYSCDLLFGEGCKLHELNLGKDYPTYLYCCQDICEDDTPI